MIKLFSTTDTTYLTNGDKIIIPTRAYVFKEDNGSFYLYLETSLDYIDYLIPNKILVANTPQGNQAFRISSIDKTRKKISLKAFHISYDANNYLIKDTNVVNKTCNQALEQLNNATDNTSPFTVSSDIDNIRNYRCVRKSLYEAWQVVVERWGGHLVRDNFNIQVKNSIGADNQVTVRYGKNLKDISVDYNWENVVTKLLPVGKDGLLLTEIYVTSTTQYDIPFTKAINFDQSNIDPEDYETEEEYEQALEDDLRAKAQAYVDENCLPKVSYTLKANLERITDVGDTIEVIDEKLGISLTTHLLSYTYDCILEKYIELQFGNFTNQLSNLLTGISESTTQLVNEVNSGTVSRLEGELQQATQQIMNVLGSSYVIYDGDKILVVDSLPKETATNVIRINSAGIGFSTTGISGTFNSAWTINGTLDMQNINVAHLVADMITGGNLNLTANTISINSTNFNVDSSGNLTCANADVTGKITATSGLIAGYSIKTDSDGTKILEVEAFPEYNFTNADIDKVNDYIVGLGTLTPEELIKYDLNDDGEVDITDLVILGQIVDLGLTTTNGIKVQILSNIKYLGYNGFKVLAGDKIIFSTAPLDGTKINGGKILGMRILFEDGSGDSGTIQLEDTVDTGLGLTFDITTYKYLEIFGTDNNDKKGAYLKVESPQQGEYFAIAHYESNSTTTYIRRTRYTISNDTLVPADYGYVKFVGSSVTTVVDTNYIKITKVIGYK